VCCSLLQCVALFVGVTGFIHMCTPMSGNTCRVMHNKEDTVSVLQCDAQFVALTQSVWHGSFMGAT